MSIARMHDQDGADATTTLDVNGVTLGIERFGDPADPLDPEIAIPTLAVHGRLDRFFPVGNGEALAREIPGARLLVLERAASAIPVAAAEPLASAMIQPA